MVVKFHETVETVETTLKRFKVSKVSSIMAGKFKLIECSKFINELHK